MQLIKKLSATVIMSLTALFAMAQPKKNFVFNADTALVICIAILAIVIISLGNTVLFAMKYYKQKVKKDSNVPVKALVLIAVMLTGISAMAQTPDVIATVVENKEGTSAFTMILYVIIGIELVVIFVLNRMIKFFLHPELQATVKESKPLFNIDYKKIWNKLNQFKPAEQEASIDTGHSYDGIRELNNVTPPWFKVAFIGSIIIAGIYLYRYHVAKSAPLPIEEYNMEIAEAKLEHEEYLKNQKNLVDENNVVMLASDGIAAGKQLFLTNCFACHGKDGQGGVGPNLTDEYWLHGGGVKDIFKSIKYGWKDKGMQSWESTFSPEQIQQLASFIKSIKGSKPAGAKDPQGDVYVEVKDTTASTSVKIDSAKVK